MPINEQPTSEHALGLWKKKCEALLFPKNLNLLFIEQKMAPACYLFAFFDCIIHSTPEDYIKLRSFFTPIGDGELEVRLPRSVYSVNLSSKISDMEGKYRYSYDSSREEDVFIVYKSKLENILNSAYDVKSNSLALKVLTYLVPYYFSSSNATPVPAGSPLTSSVTAHRASARFDAYSSVEGIASVLGFYVTKPRHNINDLILLTHLFPQLPGPDHE